MALLNEHYLKLRAGYLFPEIARRVRAYCEAEPERAARVIRCGIGDVTEPLPPVAVEALVRAAEEMGRRDSFRGYGPEQGYDFLRHAIAETDYRARGVEVADDEIFVSDGSKCDTGNILEIFAAENRVAIPDPVYPVYVDTNVMAGRTGPADGRGAYEGIVYLPCREADGFVPRPPDEPVDLVYLCSPNNPTGAAATRARLEEWVAYARARGAILLYDAAYQAFIVEPGVPRSIYEIPGARECAIEFRSFSKEGGFTGLRCAFTVVPKGLKARARDGGEHPLHGLWLRRMTTKFNGASYPVQRAAEALYSPAGRAQVDALVRHYLGNAAVLREGLEGTGVRVFGGVNAPYLWVSNPRGLDSWAVFDLLLREANVVVTPGSGFGAEGEGYFRLSAFNTRAGVEEAAARVRALF